MALEHDLLDRVTRLVDHVSGSRPLRDPANSVITSGLALLGDARLLLDALGAELAGEVAVRSPGFTEDSIARQLGEKSAAAAVATLARIEPGEARDWCVAGQAIVPRVSLQGEALPDLHPHLAAALLDGQLAPPRCSLHHRGAGGGFCPCFIRGASRRRGHPRAECSANVRPRCRQALPTGDRPLRS